MQPELELITKEIPAKGKGYMKIRRCWPDQVDSLLRQGARSLLLQGATEIYAASVDPAAPLAEGSGEGYRLEFRHDMLRLERPLDGTCPPPEGRLTLEPLSREKVGQWLTLYNECFFDVPNSASCGRTDLERMQAEGSRCGLALADGVPVGIYLLGFQEADPEIESIGLCKDFRGKGLGRELLRAVLALLAGEGFARAWLSVSTANDRAYQLYQSAGFVQTRLLSHWYQVISEGDLLA
ncbi:GNAT family N-acetyltransferase [uncultured Pseudoflavonifractor sp.]|uniref:GNAT family N-acetyltransferase n=1 Tax=uncultured Pseudoflavonifractor sp. TaxID=1221379 RepID=UPI0025CC3DCC|nr:GNAT family N-acetyltransferase [uncultured Pseudoflavonifractor sp.]